MPGLRDSKIIPEGSEWPKSSDILKSRTDVAPEDAPDAHWRKYGVTPAPVSELTAKVLESIGLHLRPITKDSFREKNVFAKYSGGLHVTFVRTGGPAEKAGFRGDIVVKLQGRLMASLADLDVAMKDAAEQIKRKDADSLQFDVLRSGETVRVNVPVPDLAVAMSSITASDFPKQVPGRIEAATQRRDELIQKRELAKQGVGRIEVQVLRVPKVEPVKLDERQKLAMESLLPKAGDKGPLLDGKTIAFPEVSVQAIDLHVSGGGGKPFSTAMPDKDGKFVFENVPAGGVMLNPVFRVGPKEGVRDPAALLAPTRVRPGETTTCSLFGNGRPITGQVTLPSSFKPEDCRIELHYSAPPMPRVPGTDFRETHDLAWHIHGLLAGERRTATLDAQGRFRIDGVREGNYRIFVLGKRDGKPVQLGFESALQPGSSPVEHGKVTIPLMSGGESDQSHDLGMLKCRFDENSAKIDRIDGQLRNEKRESVKVAIERITVFVLRFADAQSALAAMKAEAAIRKIRGFEATIDPRANAVIITADADTLKALQEILERLDSKDDPDGDSSNTSPNKATPESSETRKTGRIEGRVLPFPKLEELPKLDERLKTKLDSLSDEERKKLGIDTAPLETRVHSIDLYVGGSGQLFASAEIADNGTFAFENVPAGQVKVIPVFRHGSDEAVRVPRALSFPATVRRGETTEFGLFGKGRPVTGTITLPSGIKPEECRIALHYLPPPTRRVGNGNGSPKYSDPASNVHALLESQRRGAMLDAEGRFRIEGVREGNYSVVMS